ncbi:MAG: hypothetical protein JW937_01905, partial [Candidatus Omnitrophica bacterium]|nr:hypothetical protein [Candidatus Omnitrophota bacterium]
CVVVSSDNEVKHYARTHQAVWMSADELQALMQKGQGGGPSAPASLKKDRRINPREIRQINDELCREWGIE